ncbi:MAG: PASTA domain-containing protein, partial [Clostridia bacterium]|nr:PASTA domain-containing protein [Clostridia bacterium]
IMLLRDGTIKVMDFGIARFADSETRTMTEKAIGSVHYISPEQARGEATDDKSDIYSVGVMMYEMLTGKLPFEAESAVSVAIMQMQTSPKSPRELNAELPEGLEDIVLRAMQKDPLQRYQTADEMLTDIEAFKRNPSIHFEYKYFVDEDPTKYVTAIDEIKGENEEGKDAKRKKVPFIPVLSGVAAAVLLVALVAVGLYLYSLGLFNPTTSNMVPAPNLVGQKLTDVQANANYKSFTIKQSNTTYSATVPAGCIISQDPKSSIRIKSNAEIDVVVSNGPEMVKVPDVTNQDQNTAQNQMQVNNLTYKIVQQYDDTITEGYVISTDPAKGTSVAINTQVTIYVSQGQSVTTISMPNLVGMDINDAKNTIQTSKLSLGKVTGVPNSAPKGQVIWQSIDKGKTVSQNQPVDLKYSLGLPDVTFSIKLPFNSLKYTVSINVNYQSYNNTDAGYVMPFTTNGGSSNIPVKIEGGAYNGTHDVQILVNGDLYQEMNVNFDTGTVAKIIKDNSSIFNSSSSSTASSSSSSISST